MTNEFYAFNGNDVDSGDNHNRGSDHSRAARLRQMLGSDDTGGVRISRDDEDFLVAYAAKERAAAGSASRPLPVGDLLRGGAVGPDVEAARDASFDQVPGVQNY